MCRMIAPQVKSMGDKDPRKQMFYQLLLKIIHTCNPNMTKKHTKAFQL